MSKLVDTNLFIRYLTEDDPKKAGAVERLLKQSNNLILLDLVFAQIVWVLQSPFYGLSKNEIAEKLSALLEVKSLKVNRNLLRRTLEYFVNTKLEFIDAYQAAYCEEWDLGGIYSYDPDFDKVKTIKRFEP